MEIKNISTTGFLYSSLKIYCSFTDVNFPAVCNYEYDNSEYSQAKTQQLFDAYWFSMIILYCYDLETLNVNVRYACTDIRPIIVTIIKLCWTTIEWSHFSEIFGVNHDLLTPATLPEPQVTDQESSNNAVQKSSFKLFPNAIHYFDISVGFSTRYVPLSSSFHSPFTIS